MKPPLPGFCSLCGLAPGASIFEFVPPSVAEPLVLAVKLMQVPLPPPPQVISHYQCKEQRDIHRFEKISNIIKQFKLSCR